jgi:hypothetical protein
MPTMPALAMIGAMSTPSSASTMTMTIAMISPPAMLFRIDPIVWARCWRRSPAPGRRSASTAPAFVPAITPGTAPALARRTTRSIARLTNHRKTSPTTMMTTIDPVTVTYSGSPFAQGRFHSARSNQSRSAMAPAYGRLRCWP